MIAPVKENANKNTKTKLQREKRETKRFNYYVLICNRG